MPVFEVGLIKLSIELALCDALLLGDTSRRRFALTPAITQYVDRAPRWKDESAQLA